MIRYDFLLGRLVVLITDPQIYIIPLLVSFTCELEYIFHIFCIPLLAPPSSSMQNNNCPSFLD